ncbi:TM2 domain-containing protein [Thalassospira sp.]|uniref:TM2 domain-containing protein n=1 Tax=Thalassospira sp. TaxID=1912094 RepID=UPI00311FA738
MTEANQEQPSLTPDTVKPKKFCSECGQSLDLEALHCSNCGKASPPLHPTTKHNTQDVSKRSFAVAVSLCGIFGLLGIHHFYLRNIVHGLIDFLMFITAIVCLLNDDPIWVFLGVPILLIDFGHTMWVMYHLFVGKTKDGDGKIVAYPGQFN